MRAPAPSLPGLAARLAHAVARRRHAPALHPHGVRATGVLRIRPAGVRWGVPWLDEPVDHPVRLRWSRALGLPAGLPDGLGIALRVPDAGGPGQPLDLLFTSSGSGRWTRHLPLPRRDALAGPCSTLLSYRLGGRTAVLALRPLPGPGLRGPGTLAGLRGALRAGPLTFALCAAGPGGAWHVLGTLTTGAPEEGPPEATDSYDPYLHRLPGLRPTARLARLREAAYAASRKGRRAPAR
ncbi:phosphodiesterase [Streptomyces sp. NPDC126503]|uniref:phosphodiesterase n=1 Tax=Streptomyces sp. NPDC126503 TaxID=3155315 RepID=UPI00332C6EB7